jgi:hypothetical protein
MSQRPVATGTAARVLDVAAGCTGTKVLHIIKQSFGSDYTGFKL